MYKYFMTLLFLMSVHAFATEHPSVTELLDKYAATQDEIYQSFIIKSEMSCESSSSKPGEVGLVRHMASTDEFRFDDKNGRFSNRTFIWGNVGSAFENIPKDNPAYQSYMWDGKDYFQYARSPFNPVSKLGKVHLTRNRARDTSNKPYRQGGLSGLRGAIFGSNERIESELRRAQTISVQDRTEKIGDSECYVVDAITKLGKITVWIDPKHGYNIAKFNLEISGKRGDIVYGRPLEEDDIIHLSQRVTRFEKLNGFWIPMEGDSSYHRDMGKDYSESRTHEKITEIKLNVDHDALGSFVPNDILNGARVFVTGVEGIMYTWQDGKLIPNIDKVAVDQIDKMTEEIMAEGKVPPSLATAQKPEHAPNEPNITIDTQPKVEVNILEIPREIPAESTPSLVWAFLSAGVVIIGVIVWLVFRRRKS